MRRGPYGGGVTPPERPGNTENPCSGSGEPRYEHLFWEHLYPEHPFVSTPPSRKFRTHDPQPNEHMFDFAIERAYDAAHGIAQDQCPSA